MDRTDLAFAGIAGQAELVRAGEVSPRELVELCLERIARVDPQLNAVRVVFAERALAEADQAAGRRGAGDERPLLGVPILIKDDTDVAGEITCKGSSAEDQPAAADAEVVRRLRAAGAIVLGKTHVPELMQWPFTESATWGITRNPWALDRSPGGSSGGSAAAVAAGLAGAASASDGAGSIRIPASCCALFGLKGQRGRIPTAPYDISWQGLTHVGCVTRSVRDTALWWDVVADRFESDPLGTWVEAAGREPGTLRIACATNNALFAPVAKQQRAAFEETIALLRALGHTVEETKIPYADLLGDLVPRYLRGIAEDARTLPDRSRLDRRSKGLARLGGLLPDGVVDSADRAVEADREKFVRIFEDVDVLLLPLFTELPPRIGAYEGLNAIRSLDKAFNYTPFPGLMNHMELPAIAVPTARTHGGFPLGVQLVGPQGSEGRLLALAAQLEGAIGWPGRRPPAFE